MVLGYIDGKCDEDMVNILGSISDTIVKSLEDIYLLLPILCTGDILVVRHNSVVKFDGVLTSALHERGVTTQTLCDTTCRTVGYKEYDKLLMDYINGGGTLIDLCNKHNISIMRLQKYIKGTLVSYNKDLYDTFQAKKLEFKKKCIRDRSIGIRINIITCYKIVRESVDTGNSLVVLCKRYGIKRKTIYRFISMYLKEMDNDLYHRYKNMDTLSRSRDITEYITIVEHYIRDNNTNMERLCKEYGIARSSVGNFINNKLEVYNKELYDSYINTLKSRKEYKEYLKGAKQERYKKIVEEYISSDKSLAEICKREILCESVVRTYVNSIKECDINLYNRYKDRVNKQRAFFTDETVIELRELLEEYFNSSNSLEDLCKLKGVSYRRMQNYIYRYLKGKDIDLYTRYKMYTRGKDKLNELN